MLARGLLRRCPRCGQGHLFRRWFEMVEHCPRCGYRFEREEGFLLGVMTINIALSTTVFVVYVVVAFVLTLPDPPLVLLTVIGLVLLGVGPVLFYPIAKTVWAAIDLAMRPLDVAEEAEAVTWLAASHEPEEERGPGA